MKALPKLIINPKKIIRNEELITLRGGYEQDGNYTWLCFRSPGVYLGCVTSFINLESTGCAYCHAFFGDPILIEGPYPYSSGCI